MRRRIVMQRPSRGLITGSDVHGPKVELARAMRRTANSAERFAWAQLRDRRCLGLKFRRQHVIDGFIVDFYCDARRLVVEIDGGVHDEPTRRSLDDERTRVLERRGLRVLRVRDAEVLAGTLVEHISQELAPG